jgi:hypothetical protein
MLSDFSFASFVAWDVFVVSGAMTGSLFFMFTVGKYTAIPSVCAVMFAAAFTVLASYIDGIPFVKTLPEYQERIVVFVALLVIAYGVFRRHWYFQSGTVMTSFDAILCAVMIAGFSLATVGSFLPAEIVSELTPNIRLLFVHDIGRTLWFLSPGFAFFAMRG